METNNNNDLSVPEVKENININETLNQELKLPDISIDPSRNEKLKQSQSMNSLQSSGSKEYLRSISDLKNSLPSFYYYKRRNVAFLDVLHSSCLPKHHQEPSPIKNKDELKQQFHSNMSKSMQMIINSQKAACTKKKSKKEKYQDFVSNTKRYREQLDSLQSIKQFNKRFETLSDEAAKEIRDILIGKERDVIQKIPIPKGFNRNNRNFILAYRKSEEYDLDKFINKNLEK